MKFLIVDTYYRYFLDEFYKVKETENKTYEEHLNLLLDKLFGTADFYSKNLKKLGCEAREVIFNDLNLQSKWAREHQLKIISPFFSQKFNNLYKVLNKIYFIPWMFDERYKILKAQIKYYKPDILYIQEMAAINDKFLSEIKQDVKLIVGQIASPIPKNRNLKVFDLIFTSFPHFVKKFKELGINSEYLKIAFEPTVLDKINNYEKKYDCTFIGGLTKSHTNRIKILEALANKLNIDLWGYKAETLPRSSPIRNNYHCEAWGLDMYRILAQSKITINIHIDVAENYANNSRLYEATGCGAMLITDYKDNLNELFEIGKEVVAYKNLEELVELIRYYVAHDAERELIARAGQRRTHTEHAYFKRIKEIINILPKYIK